ncbi:MAG: hypothetical protein LBD90_07510 [Bifidobacteriaceae bacterium]|jgi:hypothetical protein|nr:hypothetical protein [Bifidobacteriaceae bacterium]
MSLAPDGFLAALGGGDEPSLASTTLGRLRPEQLQYLFDLWGGAPQPPGALTLEAVSPATRSYAWFVLSVGAGGLRLTDAGYLPTAVVKEAYDELGWTAQHAVSSYREAQRVRITALRSAAQRLGLIDVQGRRLVARPEALAAAGDPLGLWELLVARVPACWSSKIERDVTVLLLAGAAVGSGHRRDLVKDAAVWAVEAIGWRSSRSGTVPTARQVSGWGRHIKDVLHSMDALTWRGWHDPEDIKPHGTLFARAVLALPASRCGQL